MGCFIFLVALALSLALSIILSALTHTLVFFAFLPLLLIPLVFRGRTPWF